MKAVLLDIEGTTTPIDFVHETLFPFARARMADFVGRNFADLSAEIAALEIEHADDVKNNLSPPPMIDDLVESVAAYLIFLIDADRKSTALKSIQGKIWQQGYESGELSGAIFADVKPAFERWKQADKTIAIFSSGSVLAQKLIFGFSSEGDLTNYISAYFDTTTGAKREAESYRKIAEHLGFPPMEILFVSDIYQELDAAKDAGMQTVLSVRPKNLPLDAPVSHQIITNFDEIK